MMIVIVEYCTPLDSFFGWMILVRSRVFQVHEHCRTAADCDRYRAGTSTASRPVVRVLRSFVCFAAAAHFTGPKTCPSLLFCPIAIASLTISTYCFSRRKIFCASRYYRSRSQIIAWNGLVPPYPVDSSPLPSERKCPCRQSG